MPWTTFEPVDMGGDGTRTVKSTTKSYRARCENTPGCTQFSWWADGGCHLNDDDAVQKPSPRNWPRALAGTLDGTCGMDFDLDIALQGSNGEEEKHGEIRNGCPLLMYVDGELQDLSQVTPGPYDGVVYLWGEQGDDHYVELVNNDQVHIVHKLDSGDYTEVELRRTGDGPGELWSCHWDFYMCLPASQQEEFEDTTVGLLGTPNGNRNDDWMTKKGITLPLQHQGNNRHENMIEYCVDNWCVSQEESIMTYHGDTTYADHKCKEEEHIDWREGNENCVLSADQIEFACKDMPPDMMYACQIDCCLGGCNQIQEVTYVINDVIVNKENRPDTVYEYDGDSSCEEAEMQDTSSSVCPDADIVKLLKTTGNEPLPEDANILYDITFGDEGTVEFKINNPFEAAATVFIRHDKQTSIDNFIDPTDDGQALTAAPCLDDFSVEVACKDYVGIDPFAVVHVYFASQ